MLRDLLAWSYVVAGPVALLVGALFALKTWQMWRDGEPRGRTFWLMVGIAAAWGGAGFNDIWFGAARLLRYHGLEYAWMGDAPVVILFRAAIMFGGAIHLYMIVQKRDQARTMIGAVVAYALVAAAVLLWLD